MKTTSSIFAALLFLLFSTLSTRETVAAPAPPQSSAKVQVSCTPDIYPLTASWVNEYGKKNPGVKIILNKISPSLSVTPGESICFFTDQYHPAGNNQNSFQLVVGREIVVPVINAGNPLMDKIRESGIAGESLIKSLGGSGSVPWGDLIGGGSVNPVHFYLLEDGFTFSRVTAFLKGEAADLKKMTVLPAGLFLKTMAEDPFAIGFCRLNTILLPANGNIADHIRIMPIDKNGSGKLEFMEDIYGDLNSFNRGVWIGKYPKSLTDHIFVSMESRPESASEVAFIEWVLNDGQDLMAGEGYSALVSAERNTQMDKLTGPPVEIITAGKSETLARLVLILIGGVVIIGLTAGYLYRRSRYSKLEKATEVKSGLKGFDENILDIPGGLFFDKTHTWAYMEKDGKVKVGLDDFLQHLTGKITKVEMKQRGERIRKGEHLCTLIQNGKQLKLYSPVSGEITAFNPELAIDSTIINQSPYTGGWIYQIEPANWLREIRFLSMADKYREWIRGEFDRVRGFFGADDKRTESGRKADELGMVMIAYQDGGMLRDHLLEEMGPEVWEEFQCKFIDTSK